MVPISDLRTLYQPQSASLRLPDHRAFAADAMDQPARGPLRAARLAIALTCVLACAVAPAAAEEHPQSAPTAWSPFYSEPGGPAGLQWGW